MDMSGLETLWCWPIDYGNCPRADARAWYCVVRKDGIIVVDSKILCWWLTTKVIKAIQGKLNRLTFAKILWTRRKPEQNPDLAHSGIFPRYSWLLILCPAKLSELAERLKSYTPPIQLRILYVLETQNGRKKRLTSLWTGRKRLRFMRIIHSDLDWHTHWRESHHANERSQVEKERDFSLLCCAVSNAPLPCD